VNEEEHGIQQRHERPAGTGIDSVMMQLNKVLGLMGGINDDSNLLPPLLRSERQRNRKSQSHLPRSHVGTFGLCYCDKSIVGTSSIGSSCITFQI